jgi:pimeloyl-ACP methyl ester carboxylesterase
MKKESYNRRHFFTSVATSTFGWMFLNPGSFFGNVNRQSGDFQKSDLLFYTDSKGKKRVVTTVAEWKIKRRQILDAMQQVMGPLPSFSNLPVMDIQVMEEVKEKNYTRQSINFTVAENEIVPAYLYLPTRTNKTGRYPAMMALHETDVLGKKSVDGQGHNTNLAYAKELAQRGYVVIAPDYPGFGDLKDYNFNTNRYQSGTMKAIFDNMRCVDLLQARPDVDQARIGVIGHSLGGHNAIFTGAFDKRLKIIVSSCGWTLFRYYDAGKAVTERFGGALGPWAQDRYMPLLRERYNLDIKKIPFDFDEVIAALSPRSFFSNSPLNDSNFSVDGVKKGIAEIAEVYRFLGVKDKLEVRYPESKHDFPTEVRFEAYRFIDNVLGNTLANKNQ